MTELPTALPALRGGRLRKQWRYVGLFGDELLLCAAHVAVGPVRQSFWGVWDRRDQRLRERTRRGPRSDVRLDDGRLQIAAGAVAADLRLKSGGTRIVVACDHGAQRIWTAKHPVRATGSLRLDGEERPVVLRGLIDVSMGHHARVTTWSWSAGAGTLVDGRAVSWNLVDGLHDGATGSERRVWVDGVDHEPPPARFATDLSSVTAGPLALGFSAEATRARTERLWPLLRSSYAQPFGTFSGTLGPGLELAAGFGVMESHDARW